MKLKSLSLKYFRNYENLDISFNDGLNIILGKNAQGKTNIVEAIYFLSITKSFLGVNEKSLINKNSNFAVVKGIVDNELDNNELSIVISSDGKKIKINDNIVSRNMDYLGNLNVIIFSPEDIRNLKDSPANRRKFLNIELSQLYKVYVNNLVKFNNVLKQRNEYLKSCKNSSINMDYLNILNKTYIDVSFIVYKYRYQFINSINEYISDIYFDISGDNGLNIKYISEISEDTEENMKNEMQEKLDVSLKKEIIYGSTLVGPHHDNFIFYLNDNNLSLYGSQGQFKMAVLSMKLAEINVFNKTIKSSPILILDDIFGELDIEKRNKLIKKINKNVQTFVTTTDLSEISEENITNVKIYTIENGKIIDEV